MVSSSGGGIHLSRTADDGEDTARLPGWSIADDRRYQYGGGTGWGTWPDKLKMRVNAAPVPVPPDAAVGNIAQATSAVVASLNVAKDVAQAFTTGGAAHGYRLSAIQLDILELRGGSGEIRIAIHEDGDPDHPATLPGARLFELTGTIVNRAGLRTFAAPAGAALARGTTYWVKLTNTHALTGLNLRTTAADAEDGGGLGGWSIDNSRYESPLGSQTRALKLRVRAHATPPPPPAGGGMAAGNLAQIPGAGAAVAGPGQVAQGFTTGPISAGYELESVQGAVRQPQRRAATLCVSSHRAGIFGQPGYSFRQGNSSDPIGDPRPGRDQHLHAEGQHGAAAPGRPTMC